MLECILPVYTRQNTQGSLPVQLQPQVSHAYPNRGMVTSASFMLPLTQGGAKPAVALRGAWVLWIDFLTFRACSYLAPALQASA